MTNPELKIADAIREVTIAMQKAIADGYRSRMIDADDLVEVLLAIADRLDAPVADTTNQVACPCPDCGMADADRLVWQDDEFVRCDACGTIYAPDA
ncbi:hypothetical protein SH661x_004376 [Planctomicrobium sp. SH661]|uniref:hypothetical protein n=1 Tax=Planctomicrobium sp. SH661 TaxID=3448124 RepID=UPI003F5B84E2